MFGFYPNKVRVLGLKNKTSLIVINLYSSGINLPWWNCDFLLMVWPEVPGRLFTSKNRYLLVNLVNTIFQKVFCWICIQLLTPAGTTNFVWSKQWIVMKITVCNHELGLTLTNKHMCGIQITNLIPIHCIDTIPVHLLMTASYESTKTT